MIQLTIDDYCIKCGRCVSICPQHILQQVDKQSDVTVEHASTCIGCGHCVAICPTDSVQHSLFPTETVHPIKKDILPSPDTLMELLRARRSNRSFCEKPVPMEFIDKILEAANLAPTASNSQALQYTLVTNSEAVTGIWNNTIAVIDSLIAQLDKSDTNPQNQQQIRYMSRLTNAHKNGEDLILRDATAVLFVHSDNAPFRATDANLAYQNASLMAETLGVAQFYTGFVCRFSSLDKEGIIRKALGIEGVIHAGMALGMPTYTFKKYIDKKPQIVSRIV